MELLPDSRPKRPKAALPGPYGYWLPIFCANCGADGGYVPEENMNFAFYLCNTCAETWGEIANTYTEPDNAFWDRVNAEQLEKYRRLLTPHELAAVVDADSTPLATLVKQGAK